RRERGAPAPGGGAPPIAPPPSMTASLLPRPPLAPALLDVDRGAQLHASVSEVEGSAAALFVAALAGQGRSRLLVCAPRPSDARDLELDLKNLAPEFTLVRLPEVEPFAAGTPEARRNRSERERALSSQRERNGARIVVASLAALADAAGDPALAQSQGQLVRVRAK